MKRDRDFTRPSTKEKHTHRKTKKRENLFNTANGYGDASGLPQSANYDRISGTEEFSTVLLRSSEPQLDLFFCLTISNDQKQIEAHKL